MSTAARTKLESRIDESSILIAPHQDNAIVDRLRATIAEHFPREEAYYRTLEMEEYRAIAVETQEHINEMDATRDICKAIIGDLSDYLETNEFLIQSNVYLRCSRPQLPSKQENIGFHRETFYGQNMHTAVNIWTPIRGVNRKNTLQYIPRSHLISEDSIETTSADDYFTQQFSTGHKLGFQYKPKEIVSGVDLASKAPMIVPDYSSSIFSGNLIHGAAENTSDTIRFSCDFRVIRKKDYSADNKQFHHASGKPYFIEF